MKIFKSAVTVGVIASLTSSAYAGSIAGWIQDTWNVKKERMDNRIKREFSPYAGETEGFTSQDMLKDEAQKTESVALFAASGLALWYLNSRVTKSQAFARLAAEQGTEVAVLRQSVQDQLKELDKEVDNAAREVQVAELTPTSKAEQKRTLKQLDKQVDAIQAELNRVAPNADANVAHRLNQQILQVRADRDIVSKSKIVAKQVKNDLVRNAVSRFTNAQDELVKVNEAHSKLMAEVLEKHSGQDKALRVKYSGAKRLGFGAVRVLGSVAAVSAIATRVMFLVGYTDINPGIVPTTKIAYDMVTYSYEQQMDELAAKYNVTRQDVAEVEEVIRNGEVSIEPVALDIF